VIKVARRRRAQADFDAEIDAHLQLEIDRLRETGLSRDDAEAAARRAFGNMTAARERFYESGRALFWDRLAQDTRYALRLLARRPGLTAAIVATLALGIGATTAVFSLVHAVVLRPLAYEDPARLVQLYETGSRSGGEADWVAMPNFRDWRAGTRVFAQMAAYRYAMLTLVGAEGAESTLGLEATDRLFAVLRVPPLLGRTFLPGEDRPGRPPVAILGYSFWRRRYGADPQVIGRAVRIDGAEYSIVGVMPPSFRFPNAIPGDTVTVPIDLWIPMRASGDLEERGTHNFWSVARLAEGTSLEQARAAVATVADNLARQYPETNQDLGVTVKPLQDYVAGGVRPALLVMLGAVALVLLLTCANIAMLLLSRAEARRREMAVRHALGASRSRLVRQTLTESLLLALAGAVAGLAIAYAGTRLLVRLGPPNIPRLDQTALDTRVLLFAAAVTVGVGLLFGLAPALAGTRGRTQNVLREAGARISAGPRGRWVRQALVAGQLSLAVMLLIGAGLLLRSFLRVAGLDLGFHASRVMSAFVSLSPTRYADPAKQAAFFEEAVRSIESLPGVVSAAVTDSLPLTGVNDQGGIAVEGWPDPRPGEDGPQANRPRVSSRYFDTMGISLVDGRLFDERDRAGGHPVALVSTLAARTYWPGVSPIGKRVAGDWTRRGPVWREIVGVVESTRHFGLEAPPKPEVYLPQAQAPSPFMMLVVRTRGDPAAIVPSIRTRIAALDPEQAPFGFQTMDDLRHTSGSRRRFQTALVSAFAALALLLAAVGVYGVMAHRVAQRNHEIGVRLALGARPADVVALVLGGGLRLALAGTALGLVGAVALSRTLASLLFGVSPLDPATYAGVAGVLMLVAGISVYVPSRSAGKVDPLATLRDE
jgi:putative ABC transport system permease protein